MAIRPGMDLSMMNCTESLLTETTLQPICSYMRNFPDQTFIKHPLFLLAAAPCTLKTLPRMLLYPNVIYGITQSFSMTLRPGVFSPISA